MMTNKDFFTAIAYDYRLNKEIREYAKQELISLTIKPKDWEEVELRSIREFYNNQENEKLKKKILERMVEGRQYTIISMIKTFSCCKNLLPATVLHAVRQLVEDGKIITIVPPPHITGMDRLFMLA